MNSYKTVKSTYLAALFLLGICNSMQAQTEVTQDSTTTKTSPATSTTTTEAKKADISKDFTGLSVSPSTLHFNMNAGTSKSMEVKIKNDTEKKYNFQANLSDFIMGPNGKPIGQKNGTNKFGLSQWTTITPAFFELAPGETKKIIVNVNVPAGEESEHAAWTVLMLDQVTERGPMNVAGNTNTIALGITPSIGFGVYIYQNPPNLSLEKIEIGQFSYKDTTNRRQLKMSASNKGDGIGFCTSYVELTNMASGQQEKLKVQKFTILPGFERVFYYDIPKGLTPGKYNAVGVVDTNNPEQVTAAELEITIN